MLIQRAPAEAASVVALHSIPSRKAPALASAVKRRRQRMTAHIASKRFEAACCASFPSAMRKGSDKALTLVNGMLQMSRRRVVFSVFKLDNHRTLEVYYVAMRRLDSFVRYKDPYPQAMMTKQKLMPWL